MKIALVSPSRKSGGSVYSHHLADVLNATIIPAELSLRQIRSEVFKKRYDVVDVQLEYRSFGSHFRTLVGLPVLAILLRGVTGTFVTIHGIITFPGLRGQHFRLPKLIAFVLSVKLSALFCRQIIVHTEAMRLELMRYGVKNVSVVAHGSGPLDYRPQTESRSSVLFFGFVRPSKGIDNLVMAFKRVVQAHPKTSLVIAGGLSNFADATFLKKIMDLVSHAGLDENVSFRTGFLPEVEKEHLATRSSILVLPYTDSYLEVSGVVHDFAGFGVCVICSQTPRFSELSDGVDCLKVKVSPIELGDSICRLIESAELREELASNLFRLAQSESWERVGIIRRGLYAQAIDTRPTRARSR
jgi:glycosyltransferase involved in cell wall biosynthesis